MRCIDILNKIKGMLGAFFIDLLNKNKVYLRFK